MIVPGVTGVPGLTGAITTPGVGDVAGTDGCGPGGVGGGGCMPIGRAGGMSSSGEP